MNKLSLVTIPNPILRKKTSPIKFPNKRLLKLTKKMIPACQAMGGVGLASTQIGHEKQFFVGMIDLKNYKGQWKIVCNPKIIKKRKKYSCGEGCLSIPHRYFHTTRYEMIGVSYEDETGKPVQETLQGFPAQIFQHEFDHLQGKLLLDHASPIQVTTVAQIKESNEYS